MYQSIFDYGKEFRVSHSILKKYSSRKVLEIGCGAGSLAGHFADAGYDYTGMDLAKPMLRIARREHPGAHFLHGDMRRFAAPERFDAVLVGGRSFTYMTSNQDVLNALRCIRQALCPGGVLVFDNFDAEAIFKDLARPLQDEVRIGTKTISRRSRRSMNLGAGWTWNWDTTYVVRDGRRRRTFRDRSVPRAFTRDELRLFPVLAGFTPIRFRRRERVILTVAQA
jgi:SAM-dependent methyltransferase